MLEVVGCLADALHEVLIFRGTLGGGLQLSPHLLDQDQMMGPIAIVREGRVNDRRSIVLTHLRTPSGFGLQGGAAPTLVRKYTVTSNYPLAGYNPSRWNVVFTAA